MTCPYCQSHRLQKLKRTTDLGYLRFRCRECGRKSNERTGTPFNFLEFPIDIVFEIVLYRLRYKLSLRNLAEMFLLRGFQFTHEAVRDWEARFAPLLAEQLRRRRKGKVGRRWYLDETYLKVKGKWSYLYRAIDRAGNLVDSMLSATRDMAAAQRFFRGTLSVTHRFLRRGKRLSTREGSERMASDFVRWGRSEWDGLGFTQPAG
jgi:putative transposase